MRANLFYRGLEFRRAPVVGDTLRTTTTVVALRQNTRAARVAIVDCPIATSHTSYSSHTYQWINAAGEKVWVKYTFKSDQGNEFLTQHDGDVLGGTSPDHHRQDLRGTIDEGNFPSWTMYVQIMPMADADGYRFNPFDLTKVWPHSDYPLIRVGTMTLNRNPENFHAQIEQSAFEPSNMVPGIAASPDKMLLGRLFSYPDAHRDDWGQAGTLVREVLDDDARARLVDNVSGHLLNGVPEPVLLRAFDYWTNVDAELGKRIEESVRSQQADEAASTGQSPAKPGSEAAET